MGLLVDGFCIHCQDEEEDETIQHILCDCPYLSKVRFQITGKAFLDDLSDLQETDVRDLNKLSNHIMWLNR